MIRNIVFSITGAKNLPGGIANANLNNLQTLSQLASQKGTKLHILSFLESCEARPEFLPESFPFWGFGGNRFKFAAALLRFVKEKPLFCFDHVRLALPLLPFGSKIERVIFAHGSESWKRLRRTSFWSFKNASLCITNSYFTLKKIKEYIPEINALACPLGLSPEFDLNEALPAPPLNGLELQALDGGVRKVGSKAILLVGRMDSREGEKGHQPLIRVFPELLKKFPETQLIFAGPGDDRESLGKLARREGVASSVFLSGWVTPTQLQSLYHHSYAFVMPSQQEGFGLVYLEAMNYGKPCVGCFDQGAEDIIVHGETGLLVQDPDNSEELLSVLTRLLENPALAREMGRRGFERLHHFFTARHYQNRLQEAILKIL